MALMAMAESETYNTNQGIISMGWAKTPEEAIDALDTSVLIEVVHAFGLMHLHGLLGARSN